MIHTPFVLVTVYYSGITPRAGIIKMNLPQYLQQDTPSSFFLTLTPFGVSKKASTCTVNANLRVAVFCTGTPGGILLVFLQDCDKLPRVILAAGLGFYRYLWHYLYRYCTHRKCHFVLSCPSVSIVFCFHSKNKGGILILATEIKSGLASGAAYMYEARTHQD